MGQVLKGVVKWFNDAKGFGFIEHESGQDVFVHYSVIEQEGFKTLKDGEPVEYELREGDKGLNAARVNRVNLPQSETSEASETSESNGANIQDESPKSSLEIDVKAEGNSSIEGLQETTATASEEDLPEKNNGSLT